MRFTIAEIGHVPSFKNGKQMNALAVVRHVRKQVRQGRKPSLKGLKRKRVVRFVLQEVLAHMEVKPDKITAA